jgi:hypothetical protein
MNANTEPNGGREAERPIEPAKDLGQDAASRAPAGEQPGSAAKATRPKSPREFIQERMRELDKKS